MSIPTRPGTVLAKEASGKIVENISIKEWRPQRQLITAGAWTLLGDGKPRSSIFLRNNGTSDVILAPNDTDYSNDPNQANAGMTLPAGQSMEPSFTNNLLVYARVEIGAPDCQVEVVEAF